MPKGLNLPAHVGLLHLSHGLADHFPAKDTNVWTTLATDIGTATVGDEVGGVVTLAPSDGTVADNDEVYLHTAELFKIAAEKPISMLASVKWTEANTDDANVFVGLMDGVAANAIVDDGAGPKASFSGAGFYKVDGGTLWNVIYSDGATQTKAELTAENVARANGGAGEAQTAGGSSFQKLEIDIITKTGSKVDVIFKIDGRTVYKMTDKTYANATETALMVGAKNGSANNEAIKVDYIAAYQAT